MNSFTKCGSDGTNELVKKLKENLNAKCEELCETRKRLDEYQAKYNKLNETNSTLETDLKSLIAKSAVAKSCAARMEEILTSERDSLRNDLEMKCRQLNDLNARHNKDVQDKKYNYDKLFMTLTKVNKASAQNHHEMKTQVQKLQKEICTKNDELCNLKNKVEGLERDNDFNLIEINAQKIKLFEMECNLKQPTMLSDQISKIKPTCDACYCQPELCSAIDSMDVKNLLCKLKLLKNGVDMSLKK